MPVAAHPLACEAVLLALARAASRKVYPGLSLLLVDLWVPSRTSSRTRFVVRESKSEGFGCVDLILHGFQNSMGSHRLISSIRILKS